MSEYGNDTLNEAYCAESANWPYDERPDIVTGEEDWI